MKFAKLIQIKDSTQVGSKKVSRSKSSSSKTDYEDTTPKIRLAVKGDIDSTLDIDSGIGSQHMENNNMDKARNARFARLREAASRALSSLPSRNVGSRFGLGKTLGKWMPDFKLESGAGTAAAGRVGGMIAANIIGSLGVGMLPGDWKADTKKLLASAVLGAASVGMLGISKSKILKDLAEGALDLSAFGLLFNGAKALGWDAQAGGLFQNAIVTASGRRSVGALFSADELKAKLDALDAEAGQLSGVVDQIDAGGLTDSQHAVYISAVEHVAAVKGPTGAARRLLEKGKMDEAVDAAKDSQHLIDVGRALLAGLTAQPSAAMPMAAAPVATPEVVAIKDAATGEVKQIPAPAEQAVAAQTTKGLALNLDMIYPWSQWVASVNPGWSPAEVSTAFILKWLANNGHLFAYGPNQVTAYSNWYPSGVGSAPMGGQGVALTTSGQMYVSGFSPEEVYATVSGIYERHFGM